MKKIIVATIILFFVLFLYFKISAFNFVQQKGEDKDKEAPNFILEDIKDRSFSLREFKDKGVVLFFWATWCPHCQRAISVLNEEYKSMLDAGIELLAIDIKESKERVGSFVKKYSINYPVLLDSDGRVASDYGVVGVPTIILIKRGTIVDVSHELPPNYKELLGK